MLPEEKTVPDTTFLVFHVFFKLLLLLLYSLLFISAYAIISVYRRMTIMKSEDKYLVPIPDDKGVHIKSAGAKGEKHEANIVYEDR